MKTGRINCERRTIRLVVAVLKLPLFATPYRTKHRCAINVDFEYAAQRAHAVIRCKPKGLCSWDFYLDGDGHHATLEFNWAGEQGSITADGLRFEVQRHGGFRGRWTLDDAGRETASAKQATTMIPTFEINDDNDSHVLRAEPPFGHSFRIERSGDVIATVCRNHLSH